MKYRVIPCYLHIPQGHPIEPGCSQKVFDLANSLGLHISLDEEQEDRISNKPVKFRSQFDLLPEAEN